MSEKYAKDGLVVMAVNAWSEDKDEVVGKYVAELKLKHRILLNGWPVKDQYGVKAVPTLLWIDRAGVVVDVEHDFDPTHGPKVLEAKTEALLAGAK